MRTIRQLWPPAAFALLALALVGAAGTKAGGNPFLAQTAIVSDTLRVMGDTQIWGGITFHGPTGFTGAVDWNPDLSVNAYDTKTCTVTGADTTMVAMVQPGSQARNVDVKYIAEVTAANTVTITALRLCGSSTDPAAAKFRVRVIP